MSINPIEKSVELVHVVAMDRARCIGVDNRLPWHLPADLKHFKEITQGGVIVMGRKTFDSLGRLLPNRSHWVLTRNTDWQHEGVQVRTSLEALLTDAAADAQARGQSAIYLIGGGELFSLTLPHADRLEITFVDLDVGGDAHYPVLGNEWVESASGPQQQDEKSGVGFQFVTYRKAAH